MNEEKKPTVSNIQKFEEIIREEEEPKSAEEALKNALKSIDLPEPKKNVAKQFPASEKLIQADCLCFNR